MADGPRALRLQAHRVGLGMAGLALVATVSTVTWSAWAQDGPVHALPSASVPASVAIAETQRALALATSQSTAARQRAEKLEAKAKAVTAQADRSANGAAALAARIQETEAQIAVQEARIKLIATAREALRARMAERQAPLIQLTASLQRISRRPPILALLRSGSLQDQVTMRALLQTMLPQVEQRTAALRVEIDRAQALEQSARSAATQLRASETQLSQKRRELAALAAGQQIASRQALGIAARESERALALAERARDLGDLIGEIGRDGVLRDALARLPGPIMRPPQPEDARVAATDNFTLPPQGLPIWIMPLNGQLVTGFGEMAKGSKAGEAVGGIRGEGSQAGGQIGGQARSRGLVLSARPIAQAVVPAPGRVAYAGAYRGYGQIVIIEHAGGWVTLVTGLARLSVAVGQEVVVGSPLGTTGPGNPQVGVELRHNANPVNPLQYINSL